MFRLHKADTIMPYVSENEKKNNNNYTAVAIHIESMAKISPLYKYSYIFLVCTAWWCRSQWPRDLRRRSAGARLLGVWVWISPGAWMPVCCDCRVLSGRGLCDEVITRPEKFYRLMCPCVWSWDLKNEVMAHWGLSRQKQTKKQTAWWLLLCKPEHVATIRFATTKVVFRRPVPLLLVCYKHNGMSQK